MCRNRNGGRYLGGFSFPCILLFPPRQRSSFRGSLDFFLSYLDLVFHHPLVYLRRNGLVPVYLFNFIIVLLPLPRPCLPPIPSYFLIHSIPPSSLRYPFFQAITVPSCFNFTNPLCSASRLGSLPFIPTPVQSQLSIEITPKSVGLQDRIGRLL